MNKEEMECCGGKNVVINKGNFNGGSAGAIYGFGVVGAIFYFLQNAATFGAVMLGIGKAIVWPAILMFKLLTYLQM